MQRDSQPKPPMLHTKTQLHRAYRLIQAGQKTEALEVITPLLAQQPNNIDAWWLAAFAAPTVQKAVFACQKVLTLKPDHWAAQHMLAEQQRLLSLSSVGVEPDHSNQPIALKAAKAERRRIRPFQIVLLLTIPVILSAMLLVYINLTGNTFGLQIGGLFNGTFDLPSIVTIPSVDTGLVEGVNNPNLTTRAGSLVIGATHEYRFRATKGMNLIAIVRFASSNGETPWRAFQLFDASQAQDNSKPLAISPKAKGTQGEIRLVIPATGNYILKLYGTAGVAQGRYQLLVTFAPQKP